MQTFLHTICHQLHNKYGEDINQLCLVVPNRRAILFIKKQLSEIYQHNIFAPKIVTSEDLVTELTHNTILDNTTLLFELYKSYQQVMDKPQAFEEFIKWGKMLLHDFNEIDNYLVNPDSIFSYLDEAYALKTWNIDGSPLTPEQKEYLAFWESLGSIYSKFNHQLTVAGNAYQGMAYKQLAENIETTAKELPYKKLIFIGFNALNQCEQTLIEHILLNDLGEIYWDADEYYLKDKNQEAGLFLRKYEKKWSKNSHFVITNNYKESEKKIQLIGCPKSIPQAKMAGNILQDLKNKNGNLKNTALVLADENLLIPTLHSLPQNIGDFNITMGYPFASTPVYKLIIAYLDLLSNQNKGRLYYKNLVQFISQPILNADAKIIDAIKKLNKTYLFATELKNIETEYPHFEYLVNCFSPNNSFEAIENLQKIITLLKQNIIESESKNKESLEAEYLLTTEKTLNRLIDLCQEYNYINSFKGLKQIFEQLATGISIPFIGEPLQGLQIMGMLESRLLDFENIILLSVNEGTLPQGKSQNTFIPFDLQTHYGLPTYTEKDAIYAYHFYRLLQKAENVHITYNTSADDFGGSEKSRFLIQLENECKNLNIENKILNINTQNNSPQEIEIIQDDFSLSQLHKIAEGKGFSPSALNSYIKCSLQFYFRYILKLYETDEVDEEIGADVLGTVVHKVLEDFYAPFQSKNLTAFDIKQMQPKIRETVLKEFEINKQPITEGKNVLIAEVAIQFVSNFLKAEIKGLSGNKELIIKKLEQELAGEIIVNNKPVKFKGFADRIEELNGQLRIIDYKTGTVEPANLKVKNIEELTESDKKSKAFQLLLYGFMYSQMYPTITNIESSIISLRNFKEGAMPFELNKNKNIASAEIQNLFTNELEQLIKKIFSTNHTFNQTTNLKTCEWCDFTTICNK